MLSKIIGAIGAIVVTLIITGVQKYLSTRKSWQLGAIVPVLSLAAMGALYFFMQVTFTVEYIIPCAIIVVLELFIWADGRHQCRKEELIRMKIKDI